MALHNTYYGYDFATVGNTTTSATNWYTGDSYWNNQYILQDNTLLTAEPTQPLLARKKTFEDELQDEIDDWLSIFKEN